MKDSVESFMICFVSIKYAMNDTHFVVPFVYFAIKEEQFDETKHAQSSFQTSQGIKFVTGSCSSRQIAFLSLPRFVFACETNCSVLAD